MPALRRLIVLWLVLAACACGQPAGLDRLTTGEKARVTQVRSGHSLVLETGLVVRLAGIEAPSASQPYGTGARAALTALVLGKEVQLLYGGRRRDRYDRALAQVRLVRGGRWIEGELLQAGAARVRTWSDNRALAAEMLELEARARAGGRGLWALPAYRVLLPQEATRARGFQIIEGRVVRAGRNWLDLNGRLSVQIPATATDDFAAAAKAPETLQGRLVRARGMLNGGGLRLDHPEAVEVLRSR